MGREEREVRFGALRVIRTATGNAEILSLLDGDLIAIDHADLYPLGKLLVEWSGGDRHTSRNLPVIRLAKQNKDD